MSCSSSKDRSALSSLHHWVGVVPEGVDRLGEANGGADVDVLLVDKLGIKVSGCRAIVMTSHWLHGMCDACELAVLDELLLIHGQVRVAAGLVYRRRRRLLQSLFLFAGAIIRPT
jgi:hypothetical protein